MSLKEEMPAAGQRLFRWRSHLPLLFAPVLILVLRDFNYLGGSELLDGVWEGFCIGVAAIGLILRALIVGFVPAHTSGRNTRRQRAESLNTTGIYSTVRHPLYVANFFIWLGISMFAHVWWLVLIATLVYWLYYERIMFAEEEFLRGKFGKQFEDWAAKTPAFIPNFRKWTSPALPFSWKSVIRREHPTWLSTIVALFVLEVVGDFFVGKTWHFDTVWLLLVATAASIYIAARWLTKRQVLSVEGR